MNEKEIWVVTDKGVLKHIELVNGNVDNVSENVMVNLPGIQKISFLRPSEGWALDVYGFVWRTKNGGEDWIKLGQVNDGKNRVGSDASQITFRDGKIGWVVDGFSVWRTDNGGLNWVTVFTMDYDKLKAQPFRLSAPEDASVWLGMTGGWVLRTTSSRTGWQSLSIPSTSDVRTIYATDELNCIVGGFGGFYYTSDGGGTWHESQANEGRGYLVVSSMFFVTPITGWAAASRVVRNPGSDFDVTGIILKTNDGGRNWTEINHNFEEHSVVSIKFVDTQNGWLVGEKAVYVTRDGGVSWNKVFNVEKRIPVTPVPGRSVATGRS